MHALVYFLDKGLRIRPLGVGVSDLVFEVPDIPEGDPGKDSQHTTSEKEEKDHLLDTLHPQLRHFVLWLQHWGKTGFLPSFVVEHTLNSFLAVPLLMETYPSIFVKHTHYGIMYKTDSPCASNIPDLWWIMRDTLKNMLYPRRKTHRKNMLHHLFMQALPCFHQTSRNLLVDEYVGAVFNVLLAFLLGLYQESNKKPHFVIRSQLFCKVHKLLTSGHSSQQAFINGHMNLVILSFMEYISQITKTYWISEYDFLMQENSMDIFFERIPLLCDDFRGSLDPSQLSWEYMEKQAIQRIHKCSRTRRLNRSDLVENKKKRDPCDISLFLDSPVLSFRCPEWEYQLLGHALQVSPRVLQEGHELLRVFQLPLNIKNIQMESLQKRFSCLRTRFISSRLHVCMQCMFTRNILHNRFRLDIYSEQIICSECMSEQVLSIDMLGRALYFQQSMVYILCPVCCKVHLYAGGEQGSWLVHCCLPSSSSSSSCLHPHPTQVSEKTLLQLQQELRLSKRLSPKFSWTSIANLKLKCEVCGDLNYHGPPIERINPLTGYIELICFCYKHYPPEGMIKRCFNIFQVQKLPVKRPAWASKS